LTTADIPSYLDGTLAGDYGFDPLGLGADGKINQYRVAEVIHARWAMLAIPGFVIPEALGLPGGVWTETGKVFLDGETGRPEFLEFVPLFAAIQIALMAGVEKFRSEGAGPAGFVPFKGKFDESAFNGLDPINPGGPLDFFNVAATPQDLAELKVKEIKNGRLAMIAALGCFLQGTYRVFACMCVEISPRLDSSRSRVFSRVRRARALTSSARVFCFPHTQLR
jgi:light-harvesting complex II chlorophyll a/b binding protein 5